MPVRNLSGSETNGTETGKILTPPWGISMKRLAARELLMG
jgi:hypothetical protein